MTASVSYHIFVYRNEDKVDLDVIKHVIQQHQANRKMMKMCNIFILGDRMCLPMLFDFSLKNPFVLIRCLKFNFLRMRHGPRREFFQLLMHDIFKSSLFAGFPGSCEAVSDNTYYVVGKMIATCIIQGGEVPACFAQAVADYLVMDRVVSPVCLGDIPDYEIREYVIIRPEHLQCILY